MKAIYLSVLSFTFAAQVLSAACPFAQLRDLGLLTEEQEAAYEAVKRDGNHAERLLSERDARDDHETRGIIGGLLGPLGLPLGGGLLNGVLQPLTGALAAVDIPTPQPQGLKAIPGDDPDHQFEAPGATDVRGICPTLNALANHGYISRDGITSFAEAANAVQTGYGFDFSLSVFLSAVGLLAGGDLVTGKYSIGGADSRVPNTLGPALGLDKHGVFEIDGSITREDVYFGNNANFLLQRWDEYVAISDKYGGLFGPETQAEDNGLRYDNSRATNPEFLAGAVWFVVSHAERVFVYEGLPNGTTPDVADYANIAPFFLDERFPEGWYRRANPFTLVSAVDEAVDLALSNPRELGGNEGLNNFVPFEVDLSSETPAQVLCFVIENIFDLAPGELQTTIADNIDLFEGFLKGIIAPFIFDDGYFNCNFTDFVKPSASAGTTGGGSVSSSGSPVNGSYPGIGVISPDSQPS
ncbi:hypothetical protein F5Y16DRAFT_398547 [Xylariaceae sp. FL0255]|nr:hypothetical protein F5Y16DRAFT_398547 [Xylariaceae sp. FL0255]